MRMVCGGMNEFQQIITNGKPKLKYFKDNTNSRSEKFFLNK